MSLANVQQQVARAAERAGRDPADVTVVAVSKGRTPAAIQELYDAGHRDFGENRAEELATKHALLPPDIRWHFVGHLQSRKARVVRPLVSVLHSLESDSTAKAWLKGAGQPPPCYLQVNVGREPQKYGVLPDEAAQFAKSCVGLGIALVGVMAIIPVTEEPEQARPYFRHLAAIRDSLGAEMPSLSGLSMGMTDDFEVAIEEGATVIRVGRAIFEPDHSTA